MKKRLILIINLILLVFIFSIQIPAQARESNIDSALAYYPLSIGDKWIFDVDYTYHAPPYVTIEYVWVVEVVKDTLMPNNETYFLMHQFSDPPPIYLAFERIDSVQLKVYTYDAEADSSNYETLKLDLSIELFDTFYTPGCEAIFSEYDTTTVFGQVFDFRGYHYICLSEDPYHIYLNGIGLYNLNWWDYWWDFNQTLRGCLVSGILYGDTTVVSVKDEVKIPLKFTLSQNYPNPFNPSTKIKYQIPVGGFVSLKVYDVLGNEVAVLVDEEKSTGSYDIEFNAVGLPSGIYFYTLKAANYIQTRKMILVK